MNSLQVAAALRVLANAFEASEADAGQVTPAAEPAKRGRGRPAKGEDQPATGAASPAVGSTSAATAAAVAPSAGTQTTAPASGVDDPFASTPAEPAVPTATLDDVRKALTGLREISSQDIALQVLKDAGGAPNLTDLKPENYGKVVVAARIKGISYAKPAAVETPDPFETTAAATTAVAVTLEDVKAVVVEVGKHTSQDTVQKVVMQFGGVANVAGQPPGPSLKALPADKYAATIAALRALPVTK